MTGPDEVKESVIRRCLPAWTRLELELFLVEKTAGGQRHAR